MTRGGMWIGAALLAWTAAGAHALWRPALAAPAPGRTLLPARLADTGLYAPGRPGLVDPANREFSPQYPLWTDGLTKRRWVYLPPGATIDASDEAGWKFPVGTRFWKEFSLNGRPIETRLLWRASESEWLFGSYVWTDDGTAATLAPDEGVPGVVAVAGSRRHSIPSRLDCTACHGDKSIGPLGFNALQLSTDRDPNAIHGEPPRAGVLTLAELVGEGRLAPPRAEYLSNPPRIRASTPATRSVLGYLAFNCGVCHNGKGEIAAVGPIIRHEELLRDGDAVARSLVGQRSSWQVPGVADGASVLVHPGAPELSALLVRMRSRSPSSQMPPLGTVVRDQAAVDAITRWIATDLARAGIEGAPAGR